LARFFFIVTAHSKPPDGHPEIFRDEAARKTRIKIRTPLLQGRDERNYYVCKKVRNPGT
jgi:hypothetical protein